MHPTFRAIVLFVGSLALGPLLAAHPAVSVVMDSGGVVYFSDLERVWMVRPDGTKEVAVADVHTHELWIDAEGFLYGEDVTNVGEAYRHRVWKRAPDGTVIDVIPWRHGHPTDHDDYGFVRDEDGRHYVLLRDERRIDVWQGQAMVGAIPLDGTDGFLHWMTRNAAGDLFIGVGSDVVRVPRGDGAPVHIARGLVTRTETFDFLHDRHAVMGMWPDAVGNVYVAVFAGQVVRRIAADGTVTDVYRSEGEWSPSGGLAAADGTLWVTECSASNRVRLRRIGVDGSVRTY